MLCLDGGGIRGLVQLEMLSQLELKTGRRITELFDWIIGTSTGGVIALGLVYGESDIGYSNCNTWCVNSCMEIEVYIIILIKAGADPGGSSQS